MTVVNLQEFREKRQKLKAVPPPNIGEVIDNFLFDLDRMNNNEVNCSFTLEGGESVGFSLSTDEYPLPKCEYTLFGWSVDVWDFNQQQWFTLPEYFETADAAYDQAELIMKAIDEGIEND